MAAPFFISTKINRLRERWPRVEITIESTFASVECFEPSYQQRYHGATLDEALDRALEWITNEKSRA